MTCNVIVSISLALLHITGPVDLDKSGTQHLWNPTMKMVFVLVPVSCTGIFFFKAMTHTFLS